MKNRIKLYNILTIVFALLTFASLGGVVYGLNIINVITNTLVFSYLTANCYKNENKLRKILKNRKIRARKQKLIYLNDYKAIEKKRAIS